MGIRLAFKEAASAVPVRDWKDCGHAGGRRVNTSASVGIGIG